CISVPTPTGPSGTINRLVTSSPRRSSSRASSISGRRSGYEGNWYMAVFLPYTARALRTPHPFYVPQQSSDHGTPHLTVPAHFSAKLPRRGTPHATAHHALRRRRRPLPP